MQATYDPDKLYAPFKADQLTRTLRVFEDLDTLLPAGVYVWRDGDVFYLMIDEGVNLSDDETDQVFNTLTAFGLGVDLDGVPLVLYDDDPFSYGEAVGYPIVRNDGEALL